MRQYRIGRADTNDIVLADATVSREHAELTELGGGRFRIKDLGSAYGTSVRPAEAWEKVTESELRHDTALRLGEYETTVAEMLRDSDRTVVRAEAVHAPAAPEPPKPTPPRPPAPPRTASPTETGTLPPRPPPPAFQFLRDLPPEKRMLVWLGAGLAGFLLISLITLILALVL